MPALLPSLAKRLGGGWSRNEQKREIAKVLPIKTLAIFYKTARLFHSFAFRSADNDLSYTVVQNGLAVVLAGEGTDDVLDGYVVNISEVHGPTGKYRPLVGGMRLEPVGQRGIVYATEFQCGMTDLYLFAAGRAPALHRQGHARDVVRDEMVHADTPQGVVLAQRDRKGGEHTFHVDVFQHDVVQSSRRGSPATRLQADGRITRCLSRCAVGKVTRTAEVTVFYGEVLRGLNHPYAIARGVDVAAADDHPVPITACDGIVTRLELAVSDTHVACATDVNAVPSLFEMQSVEASPADPVGQEPIVCRPSDGESLQMQP